MSLAVSKPDKTEKSPKYVQKEKMVIKIRSILKEDIEKITFLWGECGLVVPWNNPKKDFLRKLDHGPDLFLVGEIEGDIVASVMYAYDGHRGNVNYLAVLPKFRKNGIGKQLMKEVENRLTNLGCPKINLLIRDTNVDVLKFYEALGYKTDPVICVGKRLIPDD
jgi:ribosomal protein S18 acetylase RimI-like enzyme